MEKVYLNVDGGSWIRAGRKQLGGITYVLDGFHLEKYLRRLVSHRKEEEQSKEDRGGICPKTEIPILEKLSMAASDQSKPKVKLHYQKYLKGEEYFS